MQLNSAKTGLSSVLKRIIVNNPMATNDMFNYLYFSHASGYLRNDEYIAYYGFTTIKLKYKKQRVTDTTTSPDGTYWTGIVSTNPKDCHDGLMSSEQINVTHTVVQSTDLMEIFLDDMAIPHLTNPTQMMIPASFENTFYYYKIYRHFVNASRKAPTITPPWFQCKKDELTFEENILQGNYYADTDSF